jgi:hypothetical protein
MKTHTAMKQTRKEYISPAVIERLELELENPILGGSVVDNVQAVKSAGQAVDEVNMLDSGFNSNWEE